MDKNRSKNNSMSLKKSIAENGAFLALGEKSDNLYRLGAVDPSPCRLACPAGVNVKSYISLISAGKFHAALKVVRERNPLPGICGRICTHPCESQCTRIDIDDPVAICALKRFVADYELSHPLPKPKRAAGTRKEKVAIIGSGPAGLTAAHDLAKKGFGVTIFEELDKPGGMLIAGIPAYRLPRNILAAEIDYIKNLGVKIKTKHKIFGKKDWEKLQNQFEAVFIAVGAHAGKKLGIPGESKYEGFLDAVTFLRSINLGPHIKPGNNIIVIGGGNSAIDAARTALRLNCSKVNIVYRRSRTEMPAGEAEIKAAEIEGVKIHYLASPLEVLGKKGKVTGLKCIQMKLGKRDESGRRHPIPIKGTEFTISADVIIPAVSQTPDLSFLPHDHKLNISRWKTISANASTLATDLPGVFAGGDAVSGPSTVIDAIAQGHIASHSIVNFLNGRELRPIPEPIIPFEAEIKINPDSRRKIKRLEIPVLKLSGRKNNFEEVDFAFDETQARKEANRCLRCGPCSECFICVPECDKNLTFLSSAAGENDILLRLTGGIHVPESSPVMLNPDKTKPLSFAAGQINTLFPYILEEYCRACSDCVDVCGYDALSLIPVNGTSISTINLDLCRQCGTCVAVCATGALKSPYYTQENIFNIIDDVNPVKPNIIVFTCKWNGSGLVKSDLSEINTARTGVKIIDLMCTGQIQSSFILRALNQGIDGVLVMGCKDKHCHFGFGSVQAGKIMEITSRMGNLLGLKAQRIVYHTSADGNKQDFIDSVNGFIKNLIKKKKTASGSRAVTVA